MFEVADLFSLPEKGSHYWHDDAGYLVERIENTDGEVHVHLLRDVDWEKEVLVGLPDDYRLVGGRQSTDGSWHFLISDPNGRRVGPITGFGIESTLSKAVSTALSSLGARDHA